MVMVDDEAGDEVGGGSRRGRKNEGWSAASAPWNGSSTRPGAVCFVSSRRAC